MDPHDQQEPTSTPDTTSEIPAPPGEESAAPESGVAGPVPSTQPAAGPGAAPTWSPPQMWLGPGPYLQRRTWQRTTRNAITAITGVSGAIWALGAIAVIVVGWLMTGFLRTAPFDGAGGVVVSCATRTTGDVSEGTRVVAWSDRTDKIVRTTLRRVKEIERPDPDNAGKTRTVCYLPFTLKGLRSDAAGYTVRIGDTVPQFVTTKSLKEGAFVPVVVQSGGDR
ncbi:hypothetical protein GOARA_063_00830 [Gordonia araii NBRC 100433]|uniref:Uncharacterized protein n=1 Tax=Gordonia araii NBRC 100433 TaxID=1073574 RepID=G7H4V9_9ACTN|nr:hypothetical protein [Gordonia araii]NNG97976.1 hypothetical protein [Gordonia araii NBRC 100433]GAB10884.1 hypothetical protein GOARA_063_00830 [Gordonia araii NBRC 100433]